MPEYLDTILASAENKNQFSTGLNSTSLISKGGDILSGAISSWIGGGAQKKVATIEANAQKDVATIQSQAQLQSEALKARLTAENTAETNKIIKIAVIGGLGIAAIITTVVLLKK